MAGKRDCIPRIVIAMGLSYLVASMCCLYRSRYIYSCTGLYAYSCERSMHTLGTLYDVYEVGLVSFGDGSGTRIRNLSSTGDDVSPSGLYLTASMQK